MQISTLPPANSRKLGQLLNSSEPSFPYLEKGKILAISHKVGMYALVAEMAANCPSRFRPSLPQDGVNEHWEGAASQASLPAGMAT